MSRLFSRTDQSFLGRWWWTVDRFMLGAVLILALCGMMLVATASPPVAERIGLDQYHFLKRHLIVLGPSLLMMWGISLLSPRSIWRLCSIILPAVLFGMVLVLFIGMEIKGAQRWIHLPGFSLQPSEFIKPAFAVVAAWFLAKQKDRPEFPGTYIAFGLYGVTALLLLLQPDLGMTIVLSAIFGAQLLLAGFPLTIMIGLGMAGISGLVAAYFIFDHVHSRIDRFLDPAAGDNYQVSKALEAFQSGGLFGTGPGQGTVKLGLPDAHADFIFAVGGEEMGLIFALFLILLFAFIVLRGLQRILDSNDMFVILATGGLLVMFGLQAFVHMGSSVHLLPAKGMTLPFVSYGGSSLLSVGFSMGIILALTRRHVRPLGRRGRRSAAEGSPVPAS
jgi:cell division protein FtsW